jgi:hypothetical protein
MVDIRLGKGSLLIAIIIVIGYIIIFISVAMSPNSSESKNTFDLVRIQSQLESSKKQYENLKSLLQTTKEKLAIAQSQNLAKTDKIIDSALSNNVIRIDSNEMKAIRPGVIILGMHRSGT